MHPEWFRFKQFSVAQDHCSMKVGTDAVLLGAWAEASHPKKILDIGTGTGIIALMLAQRYACEVHAIEIDKESAALAADNFNLSPWKERMFCYHRSLQNFSKESSGAFDLIVSNPPYFETHKNVSPSSRYIARHSDMLPNHELAYGIAALLSHTGVCCLILPVTQAREFVKEARPFGLFPQHITHVRTLPDKPVKRLLLQLGRKPEPLVREDELLIRLGEDGVFSEAFVALTKEYYLHF